MVFAFEDPLEHRDIPDSDPAVWFVVGQAHVSVAAAALELAVTFPAGWDLQSNKRESTERRPF